MIEKDIFMAKLETRFNNALDKVVSEFEEQNKEEQNLPANNFRKKLAIFSSVIQNIPNQAQLLAQATANETNKIINDYEIEFKETIPENYEETIVNKAKETFRIFMDKIIPPAIRRVSE
jgi:hypothetical protein